MKDIVADRGISIIAEIGINHNGESDVALALIEAAAEAGVTGIKFQYRNLQNAFSEDAREIGDEILEDQIKHNYLSPAEIIFLVERAHDLGVEAGISFFNPEDLADFDGDIAKFDFFKVPSVELSNIALVNSMLELGKTVYVSLGCHNEKEIEKAFEAFKGDNWIAMHCVSNYPVSLSNAKLGYLSHMQRKWPRKFGYSSHDEEWEVCLIAMAMGVSVIERHITFDKQSRGLDHTTSSTPDEFAKMAMFAENMQLMSTGDGPRVPNQGELLNLQNLGRSYYAKHKIESGDTVTEELLSLRSPRIGFGVGEMSYYIGRSPVRPIEQGAALSRSDFELTPPVPEEAIEFARRKKIAIPVRLHDQAQIEEKFPVNAFEFHLSYGEVHSTLIAENYNRNNIYSIHLPDYINSTQLMDPFSPDTAQAKESKEILQRTVNFAKELQDRTGNDVPVVGSFSVVHEDIGTFYDQYSYLLGEYREQGVTILPQWLPPIAWYFGGSVKLNAMNQQRDARFIDKHAMPICMDVSHLCMGRGVFGFDPEEMITLLRPYIKHVHIADAEGIDGEGLQFGTGDPNNLEAIGTVMNLDCMKVIEVWQGHLDDGAGFGMALTKLAELFDDKR